MSAAAIKADASPSFICKAEASALSFAMRAVCRVISPACTIPILKHVWLRFNDGRLLVSGTSLDQSVTVEIEADGDGEVTVPAHRLLSFALSLPKGADVDSSAYPGSTISFRSGRASRILPTLPVIDFPTQEFAPLEGTDRWEIASAELARVAADLIFATNKENNRIYLNGLFFSPGTRSAIVATNGHILGEDIVSGLEKEGPTFILPNEAVPTLQDTLKAGDIVSIVLQKERCVEFRAGNITVRSRLVDGTYPDYVRLIPSHFDSIISIPSEEFVSALDRGGDVEANKVPARLKFSTDAVAISAHYESSGEKSFDECDCTVIDGKPFETGAKVDYLEWAVKSLGSGKVRHICRNGDGAALVIIDPENKGSVRLVMPMHV